MELSNIQDFSPKIVFKRELQEIPEKFHFKELILQSLVRKKVKSSLLGWILKYYEVNSDTKEFEVLGEKALPEGFVDLLLKLKHPKGRNNYILIEVKTGKAQRKDVEQLKRYLEELESETICGVLVAKDFPKYVAKYKEILPVKYNFREIDVNKEYTYEELLEALSLEPQI